MVDDDFDDLDIQPDEADDGYRRISAADLKKLRSAARRTSTLDRELSEYKRRDAVTQAGIDGLSARQIAVIAREAEGDQSPENLRKIAEELGFAQPAPPTPEEQANDAEINAHAEAVAVTSGAPPATHQTTVSASDVAGWGVDKRMRLLNQHPDLHERLLREEQVVLPPSFS